MKAISDWLSDNVLRLVVPRREVDASAPVATIGAAALSLAPAAASGPLRLVTCGSVDDGKSTLIGRLLHDTGSVPEDQLAALLRDGGGVLDLSLLTDGLDAEREQGITIDVAYRYFSTPRRSFILADSPGHEQYTRNMATAASTADVAVLLVDATRGIRQQTRRHAYLVRLLGVQQVVVVVNKADLVGFDRDWFTSLATSLGELLAELSCEPLAIIPVSARDGDNVARRSERSPWYAGPTLLEALEGAQGASAPRHAPLRLPIQGLVRHAGTRVWFGTVASGSLAVGARVRVARTGREATVASLTAAGHTIELAPAGTAVALTLVEDTDLARGDLLSGPSELPLTSRTLTAELVWLAEQPLAVGRPYDFKVGHRYVRGTVEHIEHRLDVNDLSRHPAAELALNDIGSVRVHLAEPVDVDPYERCHATGAFIVVDTHDHGTLGAGLIRQAGRTLSNGAEVYLHPTRVGRRQRALQKGQRPALVWLTGLSGAGKSTIANAVEHALYQRGHHAFVLDGDNVRLGLNRDLDFTPAGRRENLRRTAEASRLLLDAGLIVVAAFVSPTVGDRELVRQIVGADDFLEIHVDTPLEDCEQRDAKGLYARARRGELTDFTGVNAPYEPPSDPALRLQPLRQSLDEEVAAVLDLLATRGRLQPPSHGEPEWHL